MLPPPPPRIPGRGDSGSGAGCWPRSGCRSRLQCLCAVGPAGEGKSQRKVNWGQGLGASSQACLPSPGNSQSPLWAVACEGMATWPSHVMHDHTATPLHLPSSLAEPPCPVPACSRRLLCVPLSPASYHLEAVLESWAQPRWALSTLLPGSKRRG